MVMLLLDATQLLLPAHAGPASSESAVHSAGAPCHSCAIDTAAQQADPSDQATPAAEHASLCAALCAVASQVGMPVAALPASGPPTLAAPTFFEPLALGEARPPATPPPIR